MVAFAINSCFVMAQEKFNFVESSTSPYYIDGTYRAIGSISFGKQFGKHAISIGPTILYASDIVTSNKKFPKLTGTQLNYKYYPNGINNKWNLFMFSQFSFQVIKDKWSSVIFVNPTEGYKEYKYLNKETQFLSNFGYGVAFKLTEKIALTQGLGIGLYISVLDGDEISPDAPEVGENVGAGYSPFGLNISANFGIKYKL